MSAVCPQCLLYPPAGHLGFISANRLKSKYYRISVQAVFILLNKGTQSTQKNNTGNFLCYFYNFVLLVFL